MRRRLLLRLPHGRNVQRNLQWNGRQLWYVKSTFMPPCHTETSMKLLWSRDKIVRLEGEWR